MSSGLEDRRNVWLVLAAIVPSITVYVFVDAYPQPAAYYDFADDRTILGLRNFWNVITNLPFLFFGIAGIRLVLSPNDVAILSRLKPAYLILFVGVVLTAFGSSWFHWTPNNDTLFWDRLPMTIAFMPLLTIVLGEHVSEELASRLLWPLLFVGVGSVVYWDYTESTGTGDLRPYGLVQFLPGLVLPTVLLLYRSAYDSTRFYWIAIGLYVLAKFFEHFDAAIFSQGEVISGHALKHVAASLVPLVLIIGFRKRNKLDALDYAESQTTS